MLSLNEDKNIKIRNPPVRIKVTLTAVGMTKCVLYQNKQISYVKLHPSLLRTFGFNELYLRFIPSINLWKKCIDLRLRNV